MLGNYLQQTTSADDIFRYIVVGTLRVKIDDCQTRKDLKNYLIKQGPNTKAHTKSNNKHWAVLYNGHESQRELGGGIKHIFLTKVLPQILPSFKHIRCSARNVSNQGETMRVVVLSINSYEQTQWNRVCYFWRTCYSGFFEVLSYGDPLQT